MNKKALFEKFPRLESDEVILKKVEPDDCSDLYEILSNKNLFTYRPGNPWKTYEK